MAKRTAGTFVASVRTIAGDQRRRVPVASRHGEWVVHRPLVHRRKSPAGVAPGPIGWTVSCSANGASCNHVFRRKVDAVAVARAMGKLPPCPYRFGVAVGDARWFSRAKAAFLSSAEGRDTLTEHEWREWEKKVRRG